MVEFSEPMTRVLEGHRPELVDLCRKYRVRRLDVFGSAARGDFNEHSSDVDFLVNSTTCRTPTGPTRTWVF